MSIIVKQAISEEDKKKCLDIRREVFIKEIDIPEEIEVDNEEESVHFLAFFNNKAVATGRFRIYKSFLKFERIATLKEYRNMGIASLIMKEMQKIGSELYPELLQILYAKDTAIEFYKKNRWIELGDYFISANIKHKIMIMISLPNLNIDKLKCLNDPECPPVIANYLNNLISN